MKTLVTIMAILILISAGGTFYGLASAYKSLNASPDTITHAPGYEANLWEKNPLKSSTSTSTSQTSKPDNTTISWPPNPND